MGKNKLLTESDVRHVAKLAKLNLTQKEIEKFTKQLSDVLLYVDELGEVNTDNVTETSQTTGLNSIFRKDEKGDSLNQKEALNQASEVKNGYFKVEGVFEDK